MSLLKGFMQDQSGMETVEWVIMGGVIIVGIVAVVSFIVADIGVGMNAVSDEVETAIDIGQGISP